MGTPLKVLIAEDSPADAELIIAQLSRAGFDPAWRRVETETDFLAELGAMPDIVLSDYAMPQFSGLRAAQLTRASGKDIPFILISGTVGEEAAVEAMKHGASDYLLKDRIVRLGNAVERALEQKRLRNERSLTEEELRWKTTLLEAQLESSADGILVVDGEGRKILQNHRLDALWKPPVFEGDPHVPASTALFDAANVVNPQPFIKKVAFLNAHPDEASHDVMELTNGTVLDRYSAPVRDRKGKNYGRIWSFRDITDHRRFEAQLRQAQKMESIGMLAGGIAHDFNNILSAILGNLYLLKMGVPEKSELNEYVDNISQAAQRATDLVNQILTFSRQTKQEREPVQLRRAVVEALKFLRASVPSTINIESTLAETPPVLANVTAIHQVIMNLGTNAWHAMRDRPGTLKVEMDAANVGEKFAALRPGRYVHLSVTDTGHGMDAATVERIFDPFFTTKPVGEGTGLGLAVVLGIMQSHDGIITVDSKPGTGTRFDLYFPALEAETPATAPPQQTIPRGEGEHVLFVDDEEALARVGKKMLERLGYIVTIKTTALDAINAVRQQPGEFKLVITDLTMPGMDGAKMGAELLKIQPGLPIILATGYSGLMTEQTIKDLGFCGLLAKPTTARILGEAIRRALHP